jgi:hypothetical protein
MIKLLLAVIFSLLTVLPQAEALCCSENVNAALPACCINHTSPAPTMSDACCRMEGSDALLPTFSLSTTGNEPHSYVTPAGQFLQTWLKADKTSALSTARTPERLASNKIYLLKRSLLI